MYLKWTDGSKQILNGTSGKSLNFKPHPYRKHTYLASITGPHGGIHGEIELTHKDLNELIGGLQDLESRGEK